MQKQEKIRLGFIGTGSISTFHMDAAAKLTGSGVASGGLRWE
jgi:predicted dehydrogenase